MAVGICLWLQILNFEELLIFVLALIMKDSKQRMGTEEILELSSQKISIQLSIQSVEIKIM